MLDTLLNLDKTLTLWLNGSSSSFLNGFFYGATLTQTWIPLAIVLLYIFYRNFSFKEFSLIILALGLCVLFSDQLSSSFCKPFFQRPRPSHEPSLIGLIQIVNNYRCGPYGFFSSHAANTFSIFIFLSLFFKQKKLILWILSWTLLNAYSRIYLGVHYFGDVLVGLLWGAFVGWFIYVIFQKTRHKFIQASSNLSISQQSTSMLVWSFVLTYLGLVIYACFFTY